MASGQPRQVLRPSVLERLIGSQDEARANEDLRIGVRELRREVLRDLQFLLNTRGGVSAAANSFKHVRDSIVNYGVPDLSKMTIGSDEDKRRLRAVIADVIGRFEPRIDKKTIAVELIADGEEDDEEDEIGSIRFRVRAVLDVKPIRETFTFHTEIETETGSILVPEAAE
ncbi:MAG: type VI secretion system baseplate subunit TssE [Planctomycetes bacterium]|nr:type VI secretion system baseplate subunit TssE [Planctomycetota bacterium]